MDSVETAAASANQEAVRSSTAGEGTVRYDVGAAAVPISPSMNCNSKKAISLPKAMMAHATWEYYGDLGMSSNSFGER